MSRAYELTTAECDRSHWHKLLSQLPAGVADLHYTPEYLSIYENTYGAATSLFVFETDFATVFQPVQKHGLEAPEFQPAGHQRFDLESVYGFGGPLMIGKAGPELAEAYQNAFNSHFAAAGAVAEFCVLHPLRHAFQRKLLPQELSCNYRKRCVYVDLSQSRVALWSSIAERQRKAIAVARRKGIRVKKLTPNQPHCDTFQAMYLATMNRVGASSGWHFPDDYFQNCATQMGTDHVSLFCAELKGEAIAYFFLLHQFDTCYYHFAASDPAFNRLNATSLLMFETLFWAKQKGYHTYFLGGGRTAASDDSLLNFKASFSSTSVPLWNYGRVLDHEAYQQLCDVRFGNNDNTTTFFPAYRS